MNIDTCIILPKTNKFDKPVTKEEQNFKKWLIARQNVVIFSPHLDDAVLSMGSVIAFLAAKGKRLHIISVFTRGSALRSSLTEKLLGQGACVSSQEYFKKREQEDKTVLSTLGSIQTTHLSYVDAAWRESQGKPEYPDTTIRVMSTNNSAFISKLAKEFADLVPANTGTAIFAPLGSGRHVDHLLTREACVLAFPNGIFYADFPYSSYSVNENVFVRKYNLSSVEWKENYYAKKKQAILGYKTQYASFFSNGPLELPYETFWNPHFVHADKNGDNRRYGRANGVVESKWKP